VPGTCTAQFPTASTRLQQLAGLRKHLATAHLAPVQALRIRSWAWRWINWGSRRILVIGFSFFGLSMTALSQLTGSVAQMVAAIMLLQRLGARWLPGVSIRPVVARTFCCESRSDARQLPGDWWAASAPRCCHRYPGLLEYWGWRGGVCWPRVNPHHHWCLCGAMPASELAAGRGEASAYDGAKASVLAFFRLPVFWSLIGATLMSCHGYQWSGSAFWLQLQPIRPLSERAAALQLSIFALAMMAGQFGVGRFLDRYQSPKLALPVFIALLLGVIQIQFATTQVALTTGVILIGLGAGSEYGLLLTSSLGSLV